MYHIDTRNLYPVTGDENLDTVKHWWKVGKKVKLNAEQYIVRLSCEQQVLYKEGNMFFVLKEAVHA